jgi:hypothetical protein
VRFHLGMSAGAGNEFHAKVRPAFCFVCPLQDRRAKPVPPGQAPWNRPDWEPPGPNEMVARLFDAGTAGVRQVDTAPNTDTFWWHETHCEERWLGTGKAAHNADVIAGCDGVTVKPWPLLVPGKAPLDWAPHYKGLDLRTWVENPANAAAWGECAGGRFYVDPDAYNPVTSPTDGNAGQAATVEEMQELRTSGAEPDARYFRQLFLNELPGRDMGPPAIAVFRGLHGGKFTFSLENGDLWVPFDMTHPERYSFWDSEGNHLDHAELYRRVCFNERVNLYLRPRRWRYYVRVLVHYEHGNWFQSTQNDEWFLQVFYDRPPFYPTRQDIAHNNGDDYWHEYENVWLSYDPGIDYKWTHSQAALDMSDQIFDQQWWSLCEFYIYTGNEPASITVWKCPPEPGDIVLGVGTVSRATGMEQRIWVRQEEDATDRYPRILLGQWMSDWQPSGDSGGVWVGY